MDSLAALIIKSVTLTAISFKLFTGKINSKSVWARGYKTFFMLNLIEHEISNAHKYKHIKNSAFFRLR